MSAAGVFRCVIMLKRNIVHVKEQYFLQRRESSGADMHFSGSFGGWSERYAFTGKRFALSKTKPFILPFPRIHLGRNMELNLLGTSESITYWIYKLAKLLSFEYNLEFAQLITVS